MSSILEFWRREQILAYLNTMSIVPKAPPKRRVHNKPCTYTTAERTVLQPFREKYEREENKHERAQLLRTEILPALFNYWIERGDRQQTAEESTNSVQVCLSRSAASDIITDQYVETCAIHTEQLAQVSQITSYLPWQNYCPQTRRGARDSSGKSATGTPRHTPM